MSAEAATWWAGRPAVRRTRPERCACRGCRRPGRKRRIPLAARRSPAGRRTPALAGRRTPASRRTPEMHRSLATPEMHRSLASRHSGVCPTLAGFRNPVVRRNPVECRSPAEFRSPAASRTPGASRSPAGCCRPGSRRPAPVHRSPRPGPREPRQERRMVGRRARRFSHIVDERAIGVRCQRRRHAGVVMREPGRGGGHEAAGLYRADPGRLLLEPPYKPSAGARSISSSAF